jgi:hypothetical protein
VVIGVKELEKTAFFFLVGERETRTNPVGHEKGGWQRVRDLVACGWRVSQSIVPDAGG